MIIFEGGVRYNVRIRPNGSLYKKPAPLLSKDQRVAICTANGRNSKGPIHPHVGSMRECYPEKFSARFWSKVDRSNAEGCWPWVGAKFKGGYGRVNSGGKFLRAHCIAFELVKHKIPEGMEVCHSCDNPSCCNPAHLWAGTHRQNMRDCKDKGRFNPERGEDRYNSKLTKENVQEIRARHAGGESVGSIARSFSVDNSTIRRIVLRLRWRHVA